MTVQIALCDDESAELDKLEYMLASWDRRHAECDLVIERFLDADEMLCRILEEGYAPDLLLLDIYLQGRQGMEAAREIRRMGRRCGIIFITSSKEHALEAFDVDAVQYLLKPVLRYELFSVLDRFTEDMKAKKKYILLKDHGIKRVELHDIVYCEAQKKSQRICLIDGTELLQNMTLSKVYEMLSVCREFVKVGISYVNNLEHIVSLNAREAQMDNGKTIYLPRGAYRGLREQYFDYYYSEEEGEAWTP